MRELARRRRMAVALRQATRTAEVGLVLLVLLVAAVAVVMSRR